jgi:hypothetical protein
VSRDGVVLRTVLGLILVAVSMVVGTLPARSDPPIPYDGPSWMSRVALVGDSFTYIAGDVFKAEMQKEWWRTASSSFGGVRTETMRDTIRGMASDRPDAFIVELGGNDVLPLLNDEYDLAYEQSQISGILDDITAAGVPCVVWAGPNGHFDDGGPVDMWTKRINDEIRAQLVLRGNGVFADWTSIADAHPEYLLPWDKHLTEPGKHAYGQMLTDSLRNCSRNPRGSLDAVKGGVGARVTGWTFDPDTASANEAHVYIDGQFAGAVTADRPRTDVGAAYPYAGSQHGFDDGFAVGAGRHDVCVFAINVAYGLTNPGLGCRSLQVSGIPAGSVDQTWGSLSSASIGGWTIDADTVDPVEVALYVDGAFESAAAAGQPRPDVGHAFPYGDAHGFLMTVPGLDAGAHQLCAFAVNVPATPGANSLLGCRTAVVSLGPNPIGALDAVSRTGDTLHLLGWGADPEAIGPIDVHIYVDGSFVVAATAANDRPDVNAALPGLGAQHGYDAVLPMPVAGIHDVCVYGINAPGTAGVNQLIACREVSVP